MVEPIGFDDDWTLPRSVMSTSSGGQVPFHSDPPAHCSGPMEIKMPNANDERARYLEHVGNEYTRLAQQQKSASDRKDCEKWAQQAFDALDEHNKNAQR